MLHWQGVQFVLFQTCLFIFAGPTAPQHRAIRVPTIVSPVQTTSTVRSVRQKSKRGGLGVSPERPGSSRSPLSSMEDG